MAGNGDPPTEGPRDPSRRQFFRAFGRQTVQGAGSVIRAADDLRRGSTTAASELLGLGLRDPQASAARLEQRVLDQAAPAAAEALASQGVTGAGDTAGFRSPYLFDGNSIVLLDQREPLGSGATIACREPSEVATAIAAGVGGGGPVLAQVAAYGLVLAAQASADRLWRPRRAAFAAASNTIVAARPGARAIGWAVERMNARWRSLGTVDAAETVALLRAEADAIALEAATDHALLGRHGAEHIAERTVRRSSTGATMHVLVHGAMGPLSGGLVGTGFAVIQSVVSAGQDVHVWLTEAAPGCEGRRIAAAELAQQDAEHTVIPDTAVAWLLDEHPPAGVLLRADTVCANGDTAVLLGGLNVARLAGGAGVPVYACSPTSVVDLGLVAGDQVARSRSRPEFDVVPAGLIAAHLSEEGALEPPYETSLSRAVTARHDRRVAPG